MMKQFKHKTLGWIAEEYFKTGKFYVFKKNDDGTETELAHNMLPEFIGSDREEVIETDWIDDLTDDYINELITRGLPGVIEKELLRKAIQKNSPTKIKITDKQINTYYGKPIDPMYRAFLGCFLQDHNLLLKNEEYEIDFPTGGSGFVTCPSCKQEFEGSHPEHGYNMCEDCIG